MNELLRWLGEFILVVFGSFLGSYLAYKAKQDKLKFDKQKYGDKKRKDAELDDWVKNTPIESYKR